MTGWCRWLTTPLPPGEVAEVRREVHSLVTAGTDRQAIAWGLVEWSKAGRVARSLPGFVRQVIASRMARPTPSVQPTKAERMRANLDAAFNEAFGPTRPAIGGTW